jgi:CoA:oxalate CoA-transferase
MSSPLEGYRVLDWTVWQQGPVASMMLGDLGAEVIKIEQKGMGDPARGMMKIAGAALGLSGRNSYFENNNRNKKSLALDLNKAEGKEILYKLVEKSDVFLSNLRKKAVGRLGMSYDSLSRYNPRLIYALASGWGPEGPEVDRPSYDLTGLARSGLMTMVGEPDMPPHQIHGGIGDQVGAIMAAYGIVTALLARERTGEGQEVDTSLFGSLIWLQGLNVAMKLIFGTEVPRLYRAKAGNPLFNHYLCKDKKWIVLAHLQSDKPWPALCRALRIEHLEKDPRFENMQARGKNPAELISILDGIFASKSRDEWVQILSQGDDLCFECVNTISDLVSDPQALANNYITDFEHPVWGAMKVVGPPVKFSKTPAAVRSEAPECGQHTEEILTEILGYDWDDIGRLQDSGVI